MVPRLDIESTPPFVSRPQRRWYAAAMGLMAVTAAITFLFNLGTPGMLAMCIVGNGCIFASTTSMLKFRRKWKESDGYLCPWCGYNLHDTREVEVCPECGRDPAAWKDRWAPLRRRWGVRF